MSGGWWLQSQRAETGEIEPKVPEWSLGRNLRLYCEPRRRLDGRPSRNRRDLSILLSGLQG